MFFKLLIFQIVFCISPGICTSVLSQEYDLPADTVVDNFFADTVFKDQSEDSDTLVIISQKKSTVQKIDSQVKYSAKDSMITLVTGRKLFLYGESQVNYENIELKAQYMEFDMGNSVVKATSLKDTTGTDLGKPVFTQGNETFESDTISYNFKTKKGMIKSIITEQGDGILHSEITKRQSNGHIHIKNGKYTTCNADHPHFYIGLTKAIAIPDDKIVSGPAYLVIEDIPLPIMLPFGFFPNSQRRSAGILIPTYGEEQARGFFLRQGGLYIPINDYVDFVIQADVYTRGTIGFNAKSTYNWKYHFSGNFDGRIYFNRVNDDYKYDPFNDYSINWRHAQSPKANPTRTFGANVSISTASYNKNYSYDQETYLRNNQSSSIQYSKRWGSMFALNATLNHNQDNITNKVNMILPNVSFNVNRFYPFRGKNMTGKPKWFENLQLSYNAGLQNKISSTDTTFFKDFKLEKMQNGFYHDIPLSMANIRLLKIINITPSLSYRGVAYTSNLEKIFSDTIGYEKNPASYIRTDTSYGFRYAHALTPSISFSASPKVYGMFQSTKPNSYIRAIRHVITPSAGFSFAPDINKFMPNYYRTIRYPRTMGTVYENTYSIYDGYLYGTPVARGSVGAISLGLSNNLEMKVLSKNDTTGEPKKVSILDNLNFNSSYNPFKDSMRWNDVSMSGSTSLFKKKLSINFGGGFSPYSIDNSGRVYNRFYYNETRKPLRLTRLNLNMGTSFQSAAADKKEPTAETTTAGEESRTSYRDDSDLFNDYVDFDIPWSISIQYAWNYSKQGNVKRIDHTVRVSGDLSLTKKWKIGGNTGYDFIAKQVATTNLSISRDLHCWTMQLSAVPFGPRKYYAFSINANSSILQDLKWDKKKSWFDNY